jgi:hypothetical protein
MRKFLAITLVALSLGGCAQLQTASTVLNAATKSYDNPVTENELYQIESSMKIIVRGLLTYRRACIAGNADLRCRENVEAIQPYTRQVPSLLAELRSFVKNDDKVNGIVVYKRLSNLYNSIMTEATTRGVSLGV